MNQTEFTDLQQSIVWVFWPWVQLYSGMFLGASLIVATSIFFVRLAKKLTGSED